MSGVSNRYCVTTLAGLTNRSSASAWPILFSPEGTTTRTSVAALSEHHSSCNGIVHHKRDISVITYMLYNAKQDGMFTREQVELRNKMKYSLFKVKHTLKVHIYRRAYSKRTSMY